MVKRKHVDIVPDEIPPEDNIRARNVREWEHLCRAIGDGQAVFLEFEDDFESAGEPASSGFLIKDDDREYMERSDSGYGSRHSYPGIW